MVPGHKVEWYRFAEKVQMAIESSRQNNPDGGTSGLEVEFNILDRDWQPVATVGSGPEQRSFADYLHEDRIPEWARDSFQLEVFHWMIELTTRPHYSVVSTAAESRLLEAVLLNTLAEVELTHNESFGTLHGNIWRNAGTLGGVSNSSAPDSPPPASTPTTAFRKPSCRGTISTSRWPIASGTPWRTTGTSR